VSTTKGAEGLDVPPGEHLLVVDQPGAFAAAAVQLLRSPELRQQLATRARDLVRTRYDGPLAGPQLVDLLERAQRFYWEAA
jgi:Glycosyl transferases group 1